MTWVGGGFKDILYPVVSGMSIDNKTLTPLVGESVGVKTNLR